ncbi:hypothetical protein ACA910_002618 [Epithemia clementina (nom. ined.)]
MLQKLCEGFRGMKHLRRLSLSSCLLDDDMFNLLAERGLLCSTASLSLNYLRFAGNQLTTKSLPILSLLLQRLGHLKELSLGSNFFLFLCPQGLTGPDSRVLEFFGQLQRHETIESVDLRATSLSGTNMVALFRALENNRTIRNLDLSANHQSSRLKHQTTAEDDDKCWLANSLSKLTALRTLRLPANISDDWDHLEQALTQNMSLTSVSVDNMFGKTMLPRTIQERNSVMNQVKTLLETPIIVRGVWSLLLCSLALDRQEKCCSATPLFYALRTYITEWVDAPSIADRDKRNRI